MFCSQTKVWAKRLFDERVRLRRTGNVRVIAEPKGEASNRDALSSPVVCMYNVYPSQSTRDT